MTKEQCATLRFFKWHEFEHPEIVNFEAAQLLDEVRAQFGQAIVLTGDGRNADEHPAGASNTSLHLRGQAFDIRTRDWDGGTLWRFAVAVFNVAQWVARGARSGVEFEIVNSQTDKHAHIGFRLGNSQVNTLIIRAE